VRSHLDHFIIMDDVELTPAFTDETSLLVVGPEAHAALKWVGISPVEPLHLAHGNWADSPYFPVLLSSPSTNTFELRASDGTISAITPDLLSAMTPGLLSVGITELSAEALEALRLFEARPLYGRDITEKYLPQETNQPNALHFNKGCYLGQEIVERIRSRGQVHRLLTPLRLMGELPTELPTPLEADGKPVGEITSAALVPLPDGDQILALGYVRREALDTHATLTYAGGSAAPRAASNELLTSSH
jgi:folate-binding protein YgfZ